MSNKTNRSKLVSAIKKCEDKLLKAENAFPAPTKRDLHDLSEAVYHAKLDLANLDTPPA